MPRIDPLQLLTCLSVLLTPEGGILSRDQVPRLVNLMTKFSKKLVSKCVYVLILKSTENELVDLFMGEGGWSLIQTWLQDAVQTSNWDLVQEILGLLLVTPVDVERLKLNILPKLIKSLSRREDLEGVAQLSSQLVQRWLMIVKGTAGQIQQQVQAQTAVQIRPELTLQGDEQTLQTVALKIEDETNQIKTDNEKKPELKVEVYENEFEGINPSAFYKTSGKDGKLLIRKFSQDTKNENEVVSEHVEVHEKKDNKDKEKIKSKSHKSSSTRNKVIENDTKSQKDIEEKDKEKDKKKSSNSSNRSSSSSSKHKSSSRNRDEKDKYKHRDKKRDRSKERDKSKDVDRDKHKSNGALKSSSNSSKSSKEKKEHKEKGKHDEKGKQEKDSSAEKLKPTTTIDKLGRIPKKVSSSEEKSVENLFEVKKKSFSVGIRKDKENDERPKTVKVFNSKMRSTGLEEEVKPAPPRSATTNKKPVPSVQLPTIPQKRPSPPKDIREPITPPEKKLKMDKVDVPERPGAIKLIPPKPKRECSSIFFIHLFLFFQVLLGGGTNYPVAHLAGVCHFLMMPVLALWKTAKFFHYFSLPFY